MAPVIARAAVVVVVVVVFSIGVHVAHVVHLPSALSVATAVRRDHCPCRSCRVAVVALAALALGAFSSAVLHPTVMISAGSATFRLHVVALVVIVLVIVLAVQRAERGGAGTCPRRC